MSGQMNVGQNDGGVKCFSTAQAIAALRKSSHWKWYYSQSRRCFYIVDAETFIFLSLVFFQSKILEILFLLPIFSMNTSKMRLYVAFLGAEKAISQKRVFCV